MVFNNNYLIMIVRILLNYNGFPVPKDWDGQVPIVFHSALTERAGDSHEGLALNIAVDVSIWNDLRELVDRGEDVKGPLTYLPLLAEDGGHETIRVGIRPFGTDVWEVTIFKKEKMSYSPMNGLYVQTVDNIKETWNI